MFCVLKTAFSALALTLSTLSPALVSARHLPNGSPDAGRTHAPRHATRAAWTAVGRLPHMVDRPAVAVGQDGNVYIFGGMDNGDGYNVSNSVYIYHPSRRAWTRGADLPVAREGAQAVTWPDGRIAVLGGSPGCPNPSSAQLCFSTSRVDVYTPRTNSWRTVASMRRPRYRFNAVWSRGRIYAIGGLDGTQPLASVETYDPGANKWRYVAGLPRVTEGAAATVDVWGRIYVLGGAPGGYPLYNSLYIYDGHRRAGDAAGDARLRRHVRWRR